VSWYDALSLVNRQLQSGPPTPYRAISRMMSNLDQPRSLNFRNAFNCIADCGLPSRFRVDPPAEPRRPGSESSRRAPSCCSRLAKDISLWPDEATCCRSLQKNRAHAAAPGSVLEYKIPCMRKDSHSIGSALSV